MMLTIEKALEAKLTSASKKSPFVLAAFFLPPIVDMITFAGAATYAARVHKNLAEQLHIVREYREAVQALIKTVKPLPAS
ncbi:MAG TPA: hypothetical protein VKY85_05295 [Candidatus Angelobacter sp.]|nr:hypothetical protein [Candidatus Angelobacter sp.]